MKKDYKRPSIEVVKMEQTLLLPESLNDTVSPNPSYAPGMKRGRARYNEDNLDDDEEEEEF